MTNKKFSTAAVYMAMSGTMLGKETFNEMWELLDYATQSELHNVALPRASETFKSANKDKYSDLVNEDVSNVRDSETAKEFVDKINDKYGAHLSVEPLDVVFPHKSPIEEIAFMRGETAEEVKNITVVIK